MKLFYLLQLAVIFAIPAYGQNSLVGNITNNKSEPIDATLFIPQLEKGAVTDFDGNFELKSIPNGTYTIIISSIGYETKSLQINFQGNTIVTQNIMLAETIVEMEEVIISTPFHKLQSENVMKVERVSTKSLQKMGAVNLSQGIDNIAGVSTISTGNAIGKPVIRGLSSNRVLTYTQGVRLENQQFGDEHGLGINAAGIGSVEVIKGPASLLYGSDALGGVLYLNPENFANTGKTEVHLDGSYLSNADGIGYSAAVKSSGEKLKFLLRGTRNGFGDYTTGDGLNVTNSRSNEYDLKTGIQYHQGKLKSTIRYNLNASEIGIPEELYSPNTDRSMLLPFQKIENHILSWDNSLFFGDSRLDLKLGYLFNNRREFEESFDEAALHMELSTFNYDVKYNLPKIGNFETIIGAQGMVQSNNNYGEELLIPDANIWDIGVFATTHYHLEQWDFQGGLRFDYRNLSTEAARDPEESDFIPSLDRSFNSFNAAIGTKYQWNDNWSVRLNVASGYRAPNLSELTSKGVHEGTNRYEIGNPNLENEQNVQFDLSLEYGSEHFEVFMNGFYNTIANYIFIQPTEEVLDDEQVFRYQQADANLYGGEFGFHLHPHPFDWLHWESSFETVTGKQSNDEYLPLIPANSWRNSLRFEWKKLGALKDPFGFITFNNTFKQSNPSIAETPTDGYLLVDLGIGSGFDLGKTDWNWGLTLTNAFDKAYVNHLSRLKSDGIGNMGRNVIARLSIKI